MSHNSTNLNWRISPRHSPIGEYAMAKQKYIGEFPHDIRQLANIVLTFAIGECTVGETPYWRSYIDSNDHLIEIHYLHAFA
jgi:hypothetical protein